MNYKTNSKNYSTPPYLKIKMKKIEALLKILILQTGFNISFSPA